jgi:hypothetical protein
MHTQRSKLLLGGGILAGVMALPVAWYLLSPLFITRAVNEPPPVVAATLALPLEETPMPAATMIDKVVPPAETAMMSTADAEMAATLDAQAMATNEMIAMEATAGMETAMAMPTEMVAEPMPTDMPAEPVVLGQGTFYNLVHTGQGTATIYALPDGARVLRLDDFEVQNGPDLHVYLVPIDPVPYQVGLEIDGALDLGQLKGNLGSQNYNLDASVDLSLYQSVVIWCQPFRVPFIAAALQQ